MPLSSRGVCTLAIAANKVAPAGRWPVGHHRRVRQVAKTSTRDSTQQSGSQRVMIHVFSLGSFLRHWPKSRTMPQLRLAHKQGPVCSNCVPQLHCARAVLPARADSCQLAQTRPSAAKRFACVVTRATRRFAVIYREQRRRGRHRESRCCCRGNELAGCWPAGVLASPSGTSHAPPAATVSQHGNLPSREARPGQTAQNCHGRMSHNTCIERIYRQATKVQCGARFILMLNVVIGL
jgi:hypothetical protein